ncbi:hypothetical protein Tco_0277721 [Tanacetum coccineum]
MAAPTIPVFAEENLRDPIDIRMDIIHPEPVAVVAFPAAAVVRTQAQHGEAIRGIQEHLLGVPIQEELTALRFRVDIAEAENASLRARIKTTEAIEKITRNRERQARIKIEQQLAAVQEKDYAMLRVGEIQKLEIELWNLKVKGNGIPSYTQRFQELTLICTQFCTNETEKVDKYISGLPDNIYGNVKSSKPKTLDETIELANDLMDQKLRTYAGKSDNKKKADDSS